MVYLCQILVTAVFSQVVMTYITSCTRPLYRCVTPRLIKRNWPIRLLNGNKNPPKINSFCDQVRSLHQEVLSQHKKCCRRMTSCGRWMMQIYMLTNSLLICCLFTKPTGREHYSKNMAMKFASLMPPTKLPDMHFLYSFCASKLMSITVLLDHLSYSARPGGKLLKHLMSYVSGTHNGRQDFFMTDFSDPEIKAIEEVFNREF